MIKLALTLAMFMAVGIAMLTSPTRAEEAKVVIGVDHDRDHDREMRRHHKKIVVIEHRRHRDHEHAARPRLM